MAAVQEVPRSTHSNIMSDKVYQALFGHTKMRNSKRNHRDTRRHISLYWVTMGTYALLMKLRREHKGQNVQYSPDLLRKDNTKADDQELNSNGHISKQIRYKLTCEVV
jgi:hypothetical protein